MYSPIYNQEVDAIMVKLNTMQGHYVEGYGAISDSPLNFTGKIKVIEGGTDPKILLQYKVFFLFREWIDSRCVTWRPKRQVKLLDIKNHPENLI